MYLPHSPTPSLLYFLYQQLCPFLTACAETGSYLLGNTPLKVIKTLGALGGETYGTAVTDNAVMISCTKSSFPTPVRAGDENVLPYLKSFHGLKKKVKRRKKKNSPFISGQKQDLSEIYKNHKTFRGMEFLFPYLQPMP